MDVIHAKGTRKWTRCTLILCILGSLLVGAFFFPKHSRKHVVEPKWHDDQSHALSTEPPTPRTVQQPTISTISTESVASNEPTERVAPAVDLSFLEPQQWCALLAEHQIRELVFLGDSRMWMVSTRIHKLLNDGAPPVDLDKAVWSIGTTATANEKAVLDGYPCQSQPDHANCLPHSVLNLSVCHGQVQWIVKQGYMFTDANHVESARVALRYVEEAAKQQQRRVVMVMNFGFHDHNRGMSPEVYGQHLQTLFSQTTTTRHNNKILFWADIEPVCAGPHWYNNSPASIESTNSHFQEMNQVARKVVAGYSIPVLSFAEANRGRCSDTPDGTHFIGQAWDLKLKAVFDALSTSSSFRQ